MRIAVGVHGRSPCRQRRGAHAAKMAADTEERERRHVDERLIEELAPHGRLRAGLNMSNFLLVTGGTAGGEPEGVSPDIARAVADALGVPLELVPFDGPGDVADAAGSDVWDIANIAAEPERAKHIDFSPAYCEIQATCLLPAGSPYGSFAELDEPGIRIAVKARSAYDLWLTEHLRHATLVREPSIDDSYERFVADGLEALAGLRPKLVDQHATLPGSVLLDESFTAVQQSIGCRAGRPAAAAFLRAFVERAIASGTVRSLIEKHGVEGRLSVPEATAPY